MTDEMIPPIGVVWGKNQREAWHNFYAQLLEGVIFGTVSHLAERNVSILDGEAALHDGLGLAARLADTAAAELDYRFYNHTPQKVKRVVRRRRKVT